MASILVVEDEAITALDLKFGLEDLGYEVIDTVDNGADAIDIAAEKRPDIVLMDIIIKGDMTGIEAAEKISALGIPIVYLTANTDDDTFFNANKNAVYGFIGKPFHMEKLNNVLKLAIKRAKIESQKVNLAKGFIKK